MNGYRKMVFVDTTDSCTYVLTMVATACTKQREAQDRPNLITEMGAEHEIPPIDVEILLVVS